VKTPHGDHGWKSEEEASRDYLAGARPGQPGAAPDRLAATFLQGFCSEVQLVGEVGRRRVPRVYPPLRLLGPEEPAPLLPVIAEVAAAAPGRRRRHCAGGVPGDCGSPRALAPEADKSSRMHPGAMAGTQGAVELPEDEESLGDLPVCLEAKHCEEASQQAQTGPLLTPHLLLSLLPIMSFI